MSFDVKKWLNSLDVVGSTESLIDKLFSIETFEDKIEVAQQIAVKLEDINWKEKKVY